MSAIMCASVASFALGAVAFEIRDWRARGMFSVVGLVLILAAAHAMR